MTSEPTHEKPINAEPTKEFFVDMITRDIPLEQAILDLVDNSVDGARRFPKEGDRPLDGYIVDITIDGEHFRMSDNCGGFGRDVARDYAFRFGRPAGHTMLAHSIGQFGIGMKRALFKFGDHFIVSSATPQDKWSVDIDLPTWKTEVGWTFPWAEFPERSNISNESPGTVIEVDHLRREVSARFGTSLFINALENLIKGKHRQFIAQGLAISINGRYLTATSLSLLFSGLLKPGIDVRRFEGEGVASVDAKIMAGVGDSVPSLAGWYVVCNGRVILQADRSKETGWGILEEESAELLIPKFHNQYARFRGVVYFDSTDAARVPWNTTKTDVDRESVVWQQTFVRMVEMMRPVVDFLNKLDRDITERTKEGSSLYQYVASAPRVPAEQLKDQQTFRAPEIEEVPMPGPRWVTIQYARPLPDIEFLQDNLHVGSAKAVGEKTFDLALKKQRGE